MNPYQIQDPVVQYASVDSESFTASRLRSGSFDSSGDVLGPESKVTESHSQSRAEPRARAAGAQGLHSKTYPDSFILVDHMVDHMVDHGGSFYEFHVGWIPLPSYTSRQVVSKVSQIRPGRFHLMFSLLSCLISMILLARRRASQQFKQH